jgi:hypothetical protein
LERPIAPPIPPELDEAAVEPPEPELVVFAEL